MYTRFLTASLYGLNGEKTWVEVASENGLPNVSIVGLANQSIKEAKERVHAAITNCGFDFPIKRITINLTPANRKKDGSHYDMAIALAILDSCSLINILKKSPYEKGEIAFLGELTLDGNLGAIDGALPMIIGLKKKGVKSIFLPESNLKEALLVRDVEFFPVNNLSEVILHMSGENILKPVLADDTTENIHEETNLDFIDIKGQESVKRASQVAAAGMHGMLMIGPPGVGKSMVGKRIPGILPTLSYEEKLEITQIYSVAGLLNENMPFIQYRPYRAPHHSSSSTALVGGGVKPKPGEISLAHNGVLFLDELPEFSANTIDMLRQPLEDGYVSIVRVNGKTVYPARFMLVAAMNPCKCGYYGDPVKPCTCSQTDRNRYVSKISGPLLDRIDLHISMHRIVYSDMLSETSILSTRKMRESVEIANKMQLERYKKEVIRYNSQLESSMIEKYCFLDDECTKIMENAYSKLDLSARSYHRILKLARTIADLNQSTNIKEEHLLEALSYRMPDIELK